MRAFVPPLVGVLALWSCSGDFTLRGGGAPDGSVEAAGGSSGHVGASGGRGTGATGGSSAGGAPSNGGVSNTGGISSSGGGSNSGGVPSSGGIPGTGAISSSGGAGGSPSSGGAAGSPSSGGNPSAGGGTGTGGGGGACDDVLCANRGLSCCSGSACVNMSNDPYNCGACNHVCPAATFFCAAGQCAPPPCGSILPVPGPGPAPPVPICDAPTFCCGTTCCSQGQICCQVTYNFTTLGCYDPKQTGGTCPVGCNSCVCAAPDTPIATPDGERAIASLAVGDHVLTVDHGRVVVAPILEVRRIRARHHHVVRVELANGSVLDISAPHPTADGRLFGDLNAGDRLGGIRIASVSVVPYSADYTYDILPDSDSGSYFAGGALVGSTLGGTALTSSGADYSPLVTATSR